MCVWTVFVEDFLAIPNHFQYCHWTSSHHFRSQLPYFWLHRKWHHSGHTGSGAHGAMLPSWLHTALEPDSGNSAKGLTSSKTVTLHTSRAINPQKQVLLMTCQLCITTTHGYVARARALLHSASSSSFITKRLAQQLRLPHMQCTSQISGIGGINTHLNSWGIMHFNIINLHKKHHMTMKTIVLPKITIEFSVHHILLDRKWKHLERLRSADPKFNIPRSVNLLLGADLFGIVMRHGRQVGPRGTSSAFRTAFGWGAGRSCYCQTTIISAGNSMLYINTAGWWFNEKVLGNRGMCSSSVNPVNWGKNCAETLQHCTC